MLKRFLILALICMGLVTQSSAQRNISSRGQRWEVGLLAGQSNYHGDIAPEIVLGENNTAFGLLGRYSPNAIYAFRLGFNYATISGTDQNFEANAERNLHFRSRIYELNAIAEFHFQPFGIHPRLKRFTPYLFTGLTAFYFNPQAKYQNNWSDLQVLGTEGQNLDGNKRYSKTSLAIPYGMGVKYNLTSNFVAGFEIGFRQAFTDYLDDVSTNYPDLSRLDAKAAQMSDPSIGSDGLQKSSPGDIRGDDNLSDWYIIGGFTLTYRFTPITCPQ